MTDERSGSVEAEVPVAEDVIDLGGDAGPEPAIDVDDRAPSAGTSASGSDAEAVRGEDRGSAGGAPDAGVEPPD